MKSADTLGHLDSISSKSILHVHAHPDDETMITGAKIREQTEIDPSKVHLLVATDGSESTDGTEAFVQNGGRRNELMSAADHWGITRHNVQMLGMQDAELHKRRNILKLAWHIGKACIQKNVSEVYTAGWDGFNNHSDHRATHLAAALAQGGLRLFGRRVTLMASDSQGDHIVNVDEGDKRKGFEAHSSQYSSPILDNLSQQEPYATAMTRHERYSRMDGSWRDFIRALGFVGKGIRHHVPQPNVSYTRPEKTLHS